MLHVKALLSGSRPMAVITTPHFPSMAKGPSRRLAKLKRSALSPALTFRHGDTTRPSWAAGLCTRRCQRPMCTMSPAKIRSRRRPGARKANSISATPRRSRARRHIGFPLAERLVLDGEGDGVLGRLLAQQGLAEQEGVLVVQLV